MEENLVEDTHIIDFAAHIDPLGDDSPSLAGEEIVDLDRWRNAVTQMTEFQDAGVDGVVLSQPLFLGYDDVSMTSKANDVLLDIIKKNSGLFGLAAIPTAAGGKKAASEFERCLSNGYNGGALQTESDGLELVDSEVSPILDVANRTGAPLFVHIPLLPSVDYRLNAIFGRERALSESIFKVIHNGVLDQYPNLNLVYHHLGGNISSMMGRIHLQTKPGRWSNQGDLKSFHEFKNQLENRIYIDTSGFFGYHQPIQTAFEELPSTQIIFGTDYPWEPRSASELRDFIQSIEHHCSSEDARRILGQNALELLVNTD